MQACLEETGRLLHPYLSRPLPARHRRPFQPQPTPPRSPPARAVSIAAPSTALASRPPRGESALANRAARLAWRRAPCALVAGRHKACASRANQPPEPERPRWGSKREGDSVWGLGPARASATDSPFISRRRTSPSISSRGCEEYRNRGAGWPPPEREGRHSAPSPGPGPTGRTVARVPGSARVAAVRDAAPRFAHPFRGLGGPGRAPGSLESTSVGAPCSHARHGGM